MYIYKDCDYNYKLTEEDIKRYSIEAFRDMFNEIDRLKKENDKLMCENIRLEEDIKKEVEKRVTEKLKEALPRVKQNALKEATEFLKDTIRPKVKEELLEQIERKVDGTINEIDEAFAEVVDIVGDDELAGRVYKINQLYKAVRDELKKLKTLED